MLQIKFEMVSFPVSFVKKKKEREERRRKEEKREIPPWNNGYCEAWLCHQLLLWASNLTHFEPQFNLKGSAWAQRQAVNNRTVNSSGLEIKDYLLSQRTEVSRWSCSKWSRLGNAGAGDIGRFRFFPPFPLPCWRPLWSQGSRQHLDVRKN